MRSRRAGIVAVSVALAAVLCLGACGTASKTRGAAPMPRSTTPTEWGQGAPPWFTQADYEAHVKEMAEEAKEDGITDPPVPIIRWVRPENYMRTWADCLRQQGMYASYNPTDDTGGDLDGSVDVHAPDGQEKTQDHAMWVCDSEYPAMPDREHGKPSEKTKRIYYDYEIGTLVPCLAKHGYVIPKSDIPSFEVFSEEFNGEKDWQPYGQVDDKAFEELKWTCPQSPPNSAFDYLYDTSSPGD